MAPDLNGDASFKCNNEGGWMYLQMALRLRSRCSRLLPGLLGLPGLKNPEDWLRLSSKAIAECEALRGEVGRARPDVGVVGLIDRMSDVVCQVADPAEFCRSVHPQAEWRRHAEQACLDIGAYITQLNADVGLLEQLESAMGSRGSGEAWSGEAVSVGKRLVADFRKGGCSQQEHEIDGLWRKEQEAWMAFDNALSHVSEGKRLIIDREEYSRLDKGAKGLFAAVHGGAFSAKVQFSNLGSLTTHLPSSHLRKRAYMSCFSSSPSSVRLLEELVKVRFDIANALGYTSYAQMILGDNISGSPGAVKSFLRSVSEGVRGLADEHVNQLSKIKGSPLNAWDFWYYNERARGNAMRPDETFSFPCIMEGLCEVLHKAFGIDLREEPMQEGESWSPSVRKMVAEDENSGILGYVYLDLFDRPDKFMGCATYTLRCGKRLDKSAYQIPVVAMTMRLSPQQAISFANLKTFLHEFGHALNSLVCRTEYQCLFGTRGPLDLVEIPSHFMEQYAKNPETLQLFAGVDWSGRARSQKDLQRLIQRESFGWATTLQEQIQMSMVDQELFGENPFCLGSTANVMEKVVNEHGALPFVKGTHKELWHGHFSGYGACYYSYSYARCLAAMAWEKHMASNPLCRNAGEKLKDLLLAPGGACDPQEYVKCLIGESSLKGIEAGWAPEPGTWLEAEARSAQ